MCERDSEIVGRKERRKRAVERGKKVTRIPTVSCDRSHSVSLQTLLRVYLRPVAKSSLVLKPSNAEERRR